MAQESLNHLHTGPQDVDFHRSRRMLCIHEGKVKLAPEGTAQSHLEWFQSEGWVDNNPEEFLETTIRGMYAQALGAIYFYQGTEFNFNEGTIFEAVRHLKEVKTAMNLSDETKLVFGPRDAVVHGKTYEQFEAGTIGEIIRRIEVTS